MALPAAWLAPRSAARTRCAVSASRRPRKTASRDQARESVSSFTRSSSIAGFAISPTPGVASFTHLVDGRRCCRDQLGKSALSFGGELRREATDFVQLRCRFPKLGDGGLGGSGVRDRWQHGSQGADGRVDLVRQVHSSNRQIRRGQTHGSGRRLRCGGTRQLGNRFEGRAPEGIPGETTQYG